MAEQDDEVRAVTRLFLETAGFNYALLRKLADHLAGSSDGRDVSRLQAALDQYDAALADLGSRTGVSRR